MNMDLGKLWEMVGGEVSLACCSPWGHKESDMTWLLNNIIVLAKRFVPVFTQDAMGSPDELFGQLNILYCDYSSIVCLSYWNLSSVATELHTLRQTPLYSSPWPSPPSFNSPGKRPSICDHSDSTEEETHTHTHTHTQTHTQAKSRPEGHAEGPEVSRPSCFSSIKNAVSSSPEGGGPESALKAP